MLFVGGEVKSMTVWNESPGDDVIRGTEGTVS